MPERQSLIPTTANNEDPFSAFSVKNKKIDNVDQSQITALANAHGFTSREGGNKNEAKKMFSENMAFRVKPGVKELVNDICYHHKLKKQEVLERALEVLLVELEDDELRAKMKSIK